jgi:membrane-bound lytic murein transglycosylase D
MKWVFALVVMATALPAGAQEAVVDVDDLLRAGQEWVRDNIDEEALRALTGVDQARVQQFLREFQQRLGGQYVVDLAALKESAAVVLPLLESYAETAPYAAWLKARLDYFEVADRLRREALPPKTPPGQTATPSLERQRRAWVELVNTRPVPKSANPFITRLKPIFVEAKIPPELVWLAEVESGFNAGARSPVGAAGLYQLMPATARQVGLALAPKDERLLPEKNARAAAQYLRYLYARFKDWPLALAAYNAGEGKVKKLLDRYQTRSFDRIALYLPAETQMYVPKVEATLWRREGVTLAKLRAPAGA